MIETATRGIALVPQPRGPRSAMVLEAFRGPAGDVGELPTGDDPLVGDDTPLALYLLYEQHYRGWSGVDDRWEWQPSLLRERARLEAELEGALHRSVGGPPTVDDADAVIRALQATAGRPGPSLSRFALELATLDQMQEFTKHRSAYQLKEADPHTWAIPRLTGRAKAALVTIQFGEYGEGVRERAHAALFATTMRRLGLDDTAGRYVDELPGITLSTCNLVSLFGLHRRWRGALVGHLALFEMCSVGPMSNYSSALRRLGFGPETTDFYDAHVDADVAHEALALQGLVHGLLDDEPELAGDVVFGAQALAAVEALFAEHVLEAWQAGRSSLRTGDPDVGTVHVGTRRT